MSMPPAESPPPAAPEPTPPASPAQTAHAGRDIIQAGRDVHINPAPSEPALGRGLVYAAAAATVLVAALQFPSLLKAFPWPSPAAEFSGQVWDEKGQTLAGVDVRVIDIDGQASPGPATLTGQGGVFHFSLSGAKAIKLLARKPGYAEIPQAASAGANVDITLRPSP